VPHIKSHRPGRPILRFADLRISADIEEGYFAQMFKITELPLFIISSENLNYLGGLRTMILAESNTLAFQTRKNLWII
jgi:hypothetical protein